MADPTEPTTPLVARHDALHSALDERLLVVLTALVDKQPALARTALAAFRAGVDGHATVEEERVVVPLTPRTPAQGPRRADHVLAEHALLERLVTELDAQLLALPAQPTSAEVVAVLPHAYRLRGAFEHHTERERLLYPLLTADDDLDGTLERALTAALQQLT